MSDKNPYFGATFAERKAIRLAAEGVAEVKAVDADESEAVENKSLAPKSATRKTPRRKS